MAMSFVGWKRRAAILLGFQIISIKKRAVSHHKLKINLPADQASQNNLNPVIDVFRLDGPQDLPESSATLNNGTQTFFHLHDLKL